MNNTIKYFIVILMLCFIQNLTFSQDENSVESGCFKVYQIDISFTDYFLIFVKKGQEKYTIQSKKSIIIKGQKLEIGKEYYLELQRNDSLTNEFELVSLAYPEIHFYDGKYTRNQLGTLCSAKNLIGIVIPEINANTTINSVEKINGIFTQQHFYRFIIVEFNDNMTFDYHFCFRW